MEIYYEAVYFFNTSIMDALTAYCLVELVKPFLAKHSKVWQVGAAYFMMMQFVRWIPLHISNFAAYSLGIFAAFLTMYYLDRKNTAQKIFLCVTFFSLRGFSFAMENCIDKEYTRLTAMLPAYFESKWQQFGLFMIDCLQDIVLSFVFLMFVVSRVKKNYIYKQFIMTKKEMFMLMIPSLSAMLGYVILKYYDNLYTAATGESLYYVHGFYNLICFFYYGISLAAILVFISLHQDLKRRQIEEGQYAVLASQAANMENHIAEVEKLYRDIRSLKHDMENHVMVLEGLYQKNEIREAKEYAKNLREQLRDSTFTVKSGNPVTDVILTEKGKKMEEAGISFQCDFHYPEGTKVDAFDISVILNNALANAIEAVEETAKCRDIKELCITLASYRKKNVYMIEIRNSFYGELVRDEDQLPVTTKKGEGHGFGLANIKKVAQKYCGDVEIECGNGECVVNVMLLVC